MFEPNSIKGMKGSCLCGVVKVSTASNNNEVGACHCSMCRKWSGSSLLVIDCGSEVSFSGAENIGIYQSSEWAERGFCQKCGSHLFYRLKQNKQYYIPVGIFDNSPELVFEHQIFIEEKPPYYSFANKTREMTGEEVFAAFSSGTDS